MRVAIIGTGYVGLVTGVCFASLGHKITCVDVIEEKVKTINSGKSPIFEPKLEEMLQKSLENGNFKATLDFSEISSSELIFICVGTPSDEDGSIDLKYIKSAAEMISQNLEDRQVVVMKSTVVPGTTESLIPILEKSGKDFGLCIGLCGGYLRRCECRFQTGQHFADIQDDRISYGNPEEWITAARGFFKECLLAA